jgi:hypothetical protein
LFLFIRGLVVLWLFLPERHSIRSASEQIYFVLIFCRYSFKQVNSRKGKCAIGISKSDENTRGPVLSLVRMRFRQAIFSSIIFCVCGYAKAQVRPILPPIYGQLVQYVDVDSIEAVRRSPSGRTKPRVSTKEAYCEVMLEHDSLRLNIDGKEILFRQKKYRRVPRNYTPHYRLQRRRLMALNEKGNQIHTEYLKIKAITPDSLITEYKLHELDGSITGRRYKGIVKIPRSEIEGVFVGPDKGIRIVQIVGAGLATGFLIWNAAINEK